jgi:hypothetical protein
LAQQALNGGLSLERLADKSDEQVIAALVSVRGIGRWTAEMFLFLGILGPHLSDSVLNLYLILGYKNAPGRFRWFKRAMWTPMWPFAGAAVLTFFRPRLHPLDNKTFAGLLNLNPGGFWT